MVAHVVDRSAPRNSCCRRRQTHRGPGKEAPGAPQRHKIVCTEHTELGRQDDFWKGEDVERKPEAAK